MKHYSIEGDLIICNTWLGVSEMQMDFGLFKDLHMIKYLIEIEKLRTIALQVKEYVNNKQLDKLKELNNSIQDQNISSENLVDIIMRGEQYLKYLDDLPNIAPDSLKGKKLILTGLQTNAFTGPKIIQL